MLHARAHQCWNQFSVLANMKKIEHYRAENSVHHTQQKTDIAAHACFSDCVCVCVCIHKQSFTQSMLL